jgi:hypothetical protein
MSQASKPVRYLLVAAWFFLAFALGKHRLEGGSFGEMQEVLCAFVLLNLALQWEGFVRLAKR